MMIIKKFKYKFFFFLFFEYLEVFNKCSEEKKLKRLKIGAIFLLSLCIISSLVIFNIPIKAATFKIHINWYKMYLVQSYDKDDSGCFMIQVKYETPDGWTLKNSPKYYCTVNQPGYFYPDKTFDIKKVKAEQYIYIRLVEVDWGAPNDQIIKPFIDNSGSGIKDGSWKCALYLELGFTSKSFYAENSSGDKIWVTITNQG